MCLKNAIVSRNAKKEKDSKDIFEDLELDGKPSADFRTSIHSFWKVGSKLDNLNKHKWFFNCDYCEFRSRLKSSAMRFMEMCCILVIKVTTKRGGRMTVRLMCYPFIRIKHNCAPIAISRQNAKNIWKYTSSINMEVYHTVINTRSLINQSRTWRSTLGLIWMDLF